MPIEQTKLTDIGHVLIQLCKDLYLPLKYIYVRIVNLTSPYKMNRILILTDDVVVLGILPMGAS